MGVLLNEQTRLMIQGMGAAGAREARTSLDFGTKVVVGVTPGIFDRNLSIDTVADNIDEIMNEDGYSVPGGVGDEMKLILEGLKANPV